MSCDSTSRRVKPATVSKVMTCREATLLFDDHVEGRLPVGRRQALAAHLGRCPACTQLLMQVRWVRRLLRAMSHERMPDPMKHRLLHALRRSRTFLDSSQPAFHPATSTHPGRLLPTEEHHAESAPHS